MRFKKWEELYGCKVFLTTSELQQFQRTCLYQQEKRNIKIRTPFQSEVCQRCFGQIQKHWYYPETKIKYCWHCKEMGTIRSNDHLIILIDPKRYTNMERINWKGHLTASQQKIADEHLLAWDQRRHHLTYAVTGAGKTEMLYPLINRALGLQKRIALVAPRIDVVLELARRIENFFSGEFLILHVNQHHIKYNQLVICTIQ